ncbi:alpha amylase N-terminal ig-like domain-containing protein [Paenibacillus tyrfis]|uniref:Glycoside hydrolase family 13 N-terminal Ig-like domain-containing protein n=1 Tax=Paenibacillus tyrfis TaxID=1501230 RepID=A0A081NUM6_9BACL|nr:alpha amylase N-terminal ig-like domain-containing protein [Paenibacillus tyrfis]KEQ22149.1 hypothetical protein ET33_27470 [Paenibacillus tyrfis]
MLRDCFYHVSQSNWAYAHDKHTIHLRVRTKRDDVMDIMAVTGDKYDWDRTYAEYPMKKTTSDAYFDYWEASVKPKYGRIS